MAPSSAIRANGLRYRCLLIDHDDTAVDSMAVVHYPAHLEALATLRPGRASPTQEQFLLHNFHGIMDYLVGELGLNREELAQEFVIWRRWTTSRTPPFFPGFLDLLEEYRGRGGKVVVISHSEKDVIEGHYRAARDPPFLPDLVFGWEHDELLRKPSPWPVQEALRELGLAPSEALILDDLKPGIIMSRATGVPVAAAGWSHRVPEIESYMRAHAVAYFPRVADLREFLLDPLA
ncbi:MAG TPA: HAD family phosphatase [Spirochaetia bacterium]|nr:HAD family phosphatase [Spirochaetia bacterium]